MFSALCGDPGTPANTFREGYEFEVNQTIFYVCAEGFVLSKGNLSRMCQDSGNWTGEQPVCTSKLYRKWITYTNIHLWLTYSFMEWYTSCVYDMCIFVVSGLHIWGDWFNIFLIMSNNYISATTYIVYIFIELNCLIQ